MKDDGLQNQQHHTVCMVFFPADYHGRRWKRNCERCVFLDVMISILTFVFRWLFCRNPKLSTYDKHSSHDRFSGTPYSMSGSKICTFLRTRFHLFLSWNRTRKEASDLYIHSKVFEFHHGCMVWVAYLVDSMGMRNCQDHFSITYGGKA